MIKVEKFYILTPCFFCHLWWTSIAKKA
uniref:Uncharacterized protein n=1 Tax=Anguilla anguilla TaxID=7936 RepID=A0A0E9R6A5_ANGAN